MSCSAAIAPSIRSTVELSRSDSLFSASPLAFFSFLPSFFLFLLSSPLLIHSSFLILPPPKPDHSLLHNNMVATNITWHHGAFTREEREQKLNQKVSTETDSFSLSFPCSSGYSSSPLRWNVGCHPKGGSVLLTNSCMCNRALPFGSLVSRPRASRHWPLLWSNT